MKRRKVTFVVSPKKIADTSIHVTHDQYQLDEQDVAPNVVLRAFLEAPITFVTAGTSYKRCVV